MLENEIGRMNHITQKVLTMLITLRIVQLLFILILLTSCSEFNEAMQLQDDYASSFTVSNTELLLVLSKEYNPKVTRGFIPTDYSAVIPEGDYIPVASSAGRVFYQAPMGFKQLKNGEIESKVGGIVQTKEEETTYYVWYFRKETEYFEIQPNGDWVNDVKPGLTNIETRPWIEGDLEIDVY